MLEAVDPRLLGFIVVHFLFRGMFLHRLGVLQYAATPAGRWHESGQAPADDAFAELAGNVRHARDRSAVLALGRVRGEGHYTATT